MRRLLVDLYLNPESTNDPRINEGLFSAARSVGRGAVGVGKFAGTFVRDNLIFGLVNSIVFAISAAAVAGYKRAKSKISGTGNPDQKMEKPEVTKDMIDSYVRDKISKLSGDDRDFAMKNIGKIRESVKKMLISQGHRLVESSYRYAESNLEENIKKVWNSASESYKSVDEHERDFSGISSLLKKEIEDGVFDKDSNLHLKLKESTSKYMGKIDLAVAKLESIQEKLRDILKSPVLNNVEENLVNAKLKRASELIAKLEQKKKQSQDVFLEIAKAIENYKPLPKVDQGDDDSGSKKPEQQTTSNQDQPKPNGANLIHFSDKEAKDLRFSLERVIDESTKKFKESKNKIAQDLKDDKISLKMAEKKLSLHFKAFQTKMEDVQQQVLNILQGERYAFSQEANDTLLIAEEQAVEIIKAMRKESATIIADASANMDENLKKIHENMEEVNRKASGEISDIKKQIQENMEKAKENFLKMSKEIPGSSFTDAKNISDHIPDWDNLSSGFSGSQKKVEELNEELKQIADSIRSQVIAFNRSGVDASSSAYTNLVKTENDARSVLSSISTFLDEQKSRENTIGEAIRRKINQNISSSPSQTHRPYNEPHPSVTRTDPVPQYTNFISYSSELRSSLLANDTKTQTAFNNMKQAFMRAEVLLNKALHDFNQSFEKWDHADKSTKDLIDSAYKELKDAKNVFEEKILSIQSGFTNDFKAKSSGRGAYWGLSADDKKTLQNYAGQLNIQVYRPLQKMAGEKFKIALDISTGKKPVRGRGEITKTNPTPENRPSNSKTAPEVKPGQNTPPEIKINQGHSGSSSSSLGSPDFDDILKNVKADSNQNSGFPPGQKPNLGQTYINNLNPDENIFSTGSNNFGSYGDPGDPFSRGARKKSYRPGDPWPKRMIGKVADKLGDVGDYLSQKGAKGLEMVGDSYKNHPYAFMAGATLTGSVITFASKKMIDSYNRYNTPVTDQQLKKDIDLNLERYLVGSVGEKATIARCRVDLKFRRRVVDEIFENVRPKYLRPGEKTTLQKFKSNLKGNAIQKGGALAKAIVNTGVAYGVSALSGGWISPQSVHNIIGAGVEDPKRRDSYKDAVYPLSPRAHAEMVAKRGGGKNWMRTSSANKLIKARDKELEKLKIQIENLKGAESSRESGFYRVGSPEYNKAIDIQILRFQAQLKNEGKFDELKAFNLDLRKRNRAVRKEIFVWLMKYKPKDVSYPQ